MQDVKFNERIIGHMVEVEYDLLLDEMNNHNNLCHQVHAEFALFIASQLYTKEYILCINFIEESKKSDILMEVDCPISNENNTFDSCK